MTTPSTPRKAGPYLGDGVQSTWPFAFKVFAATDLKVTTAVGGVDTTLALDTDYTVTINTNQETSPGGSVVYVAASGVELVITGDMGYSQDYDIPGGGNFNPTALENQLDRTTMQIQQLAEQVSRSIKSSISGQLPIIADYPFAIAEAVFSGDDVTTDFELDTAPVLCKVYIHGVRQTPGVDYTVAGVIVSFTTAPPVGTGNIFIEATSGVVVPV